MDKTPQIIEEALKGAEERVEDDKFEKRIILGTFVINGVPIDDRTEFFVDVSHVFGVFQTTDLPTKKISYTVRWLLVNPLPEGDTEPKELFKFTKEYDPADDESIKKMPDRKHFALLFDLNNRAHYLPQGDYKTEVYIDEVLQATKEFKLIPRRGLYLGTKYNRFGITYPATNFNGHVHTVWGMYHFEGMKTIEQIKKGRVEWIKLDKEGEEEKIIFEYPIEVKKEQRFNVFRFRLPKNRPGPFAPSKYLCVVYVNGEEKDRKEFQIREAKPQLFLGTKIDPKTYDMLDDKVVFEGKTRSIKGLYKFCRSIHKSKVGKVRWLYEHPLGMEKLNPPKKIAEHPVKCDKNYDMMFFQLNLNKFMALPGLYSCEVYLNDELQQKRHFRLLPRYDVILGKMENNVIKKRQNHYVQGTSEVRGIFKSNIMFPEASAVQILWVAVQVKDMKPNTLLSNSVQKMPQKFSSCTFVCAFKEPFPLGVYQARIFINKQCVAIEGFKVLNQEQFLAFQERKKKLTEMFVQRLRQMKANQQRQQIVQQMRGGQGGQMGGSMNMFGGGRGTSPQQGRGGGGGGTGTQPSNSQTGFGMGSPNSNSGLSGKTFDDDEEKDYDI